jgi:hypothetical protein
MVTTMTVIASHIESLALDAPYDFYDWRMPHP